MRNRRKVCPISLVGDTDFVPVWRDYADLVQIALRVELSKNISREEREAEQAQKRLKTVQEAGGSPSYSRQGNRGKTKSSKSWGKKRMAPEQAATSMSSQRQKSDAGNKPFCPRCSNILASVAFCHKCGSMEHWKKNCPLLIGGDIKTNPSQPSQQPSQRVQTSTVDNAARAKSEKSTARVYARDQPVARSDRR